MTEITAYPPVAELVPHEPPMLLVDELVSWTPERAQVRATIRAGGPFVEGGQVSAPALVEYLAQAVAVADGMNGRVSGQTGVGLLLGSRELIYEVEGAAVGETLDIFVERQFADNRLASYACVMRRAGAAEDAAPLVSGVLNVMLEQASEVLG